MYSIEKLKIKGEKDKIPTYKSSIINKIHRQYFLDKHKYVNSILDIIVHQQGYFNITSFDGTKWLIVQINKYSNYCIFAFLQTKNQVYFSYKIWNCLILARLNNKILYKVFYSKIFHLQNTHYFVYPT